MTKAERREAKRRQAEGSAADDQDEDDDDDWCVPITPEAVSQRRLALLGGSDRLDGADDDDSSAPSTDDKAKSKRLVQQIKVGSNPIPVLSVSSFLSQILTNFIFRLSLHLVWMMRKLSLRSEN